MRHLTACAFLLATVGTCFALAQEADSSAVESSEATASTDLDAIRAGSGAFVNAFNKGDAKAVAALWTEDGEYLDDSGHSVSGRTEIEKEYADFFKANPKSQIKIVIDSVRLLSDSAAIENGHSFVEPAPVGAPEVSQYTAVHVKVDGKWLMASVRDTVVETPSTYSNIADLEWLIGTWVAEEHGTKIESVCRWVANKSFVERRYTATHTDGTKTSGLELIGWNPQQGHVQSWTFSPDGGHSIGTWSPTEEGWSAEMQGVTGDGVSTHSVNFLTRLDYQAYVWQSVQRAVGEIALPDTDEVVIKRQ